MASRFSIQGQIQAVRRRADDVNRKILDALKADDQETAQYYSDEKEALNTAIQTLTYVEHFKIFMEALK